MAEDIMDNMRVPSFIIRGKTPLIEILEELGIDFKEETESVMFIQGPVIPCPMSRYESRLLIMPFEYHKNNI
jgi:hypothetical protein